MVPPASDSSRREPPLPAPRRTGVVTDPRCAGHCMGPDEPECPARLEVLQDLLREPQWRGRLVEIEARMADRETLERVHAPSYIRRLEATAGAPSVRLDPDTCTSPDSHQAALLAAGGLCRAIAQVHTGTVANAFALVRPPGHHAERAAAKGFCLYNNVAVGARFAQSRLGLERVLIVDWDLHHGNGTQDCFEDDPSVLFFSTHQAFAYPHSGRRRQVGRGAGRGFTINVPLLPGFGDGEYLAIFEALLRPVAAEFAPDLVLVSAGFDIHGADPLGGMRVTPEGFAALTRLLMDIADQSCGGRLVLTLEGGYGLEGLRASVRAVLEELAGLRSTDPGPLMTAAARSRAAYAVWRVRSVQRRYWTGLDRPDGQPPGADLSWGSRLRGWLAYAGAYFRS